jgi:hypothetical protein
MTNEHLTHLRRQAANLVVRSRVRRDSAEASSRRATTRRTRADEARALSEAHSRHSRECAIDRFS